MLKNKLFVLIFLLFCNYSFSQNVVITSEQLKITNMIFLEHEKFSKQIPLLEQQIFNLEQLDVNWKRTDSIRKAQLLYCDKLLRDQSQSIEDLNKSLKIKKKTIRYGTIGSSIIIIALCLLIK